MTNITRQDGFFLVSEKVELNDKFNKLCQEIGTVGQKDYQFNNWKDLLSVESTDHANEYCHLEYLGEQHHKSVSTWEAHYTMGSGKREGRKEYVPAGSYVNWDETLPTYRVIYNMEAINKKLHDDVLLWKESMDESKKRTQSEADRKKTEAEEWFNSLPECVIEKSLSYSNYYNSYCMTVGGRGFKVGEDCSSYIEKINKFYLKAIEFGFEIDGEEIQSMILEGRKYSFNKYNLVLSLGGNVAYLKTDEIISSDLTFDQCEAILQKECLRDKDKLRKELKDLESKSLKTSKIKLRIAELKDELR